VAYNLSSGLSLLADAIQFDLTVIRRELNDLGNTLAEMQRKKS